MPRPPRIPILLAAEVCCALRRQIVASLLGQSNAVAGEMKAFKLSAELENMLLGSLNRAGQGGKVALDNYPVDPNLLSQLQMTMPVARGSSSRHRAGPVSRTDMPFDSVASRSVPSAS